MPKDYQFHDAANIFPLDDEHIDDLSADIAEHGLQYPVELLGGKIVDGRRRYLACRIAEVEPDFIEVEPEDPIAYVVSLNLHRRHLDVSQRALVAARVRELYAKPAKERQSTKGGHSGPVNLPEAKGDTRDTAGRSIGVSGKSVDHATKVLKTGSPELVAAVEKGEVAVSAAAKIAELPKPEQKKAVESGKAGMKAAANNVHVSKNTGVPEWYTPAEYIEAAREVMGTIDLDPASSDIAQTTVKAKKFFTIHDDGLSKKWKGRVWLNPPYASGIIDKFMAMVCRTHETGQVPEAITLTNNATDTAWFQDAAYVAAAVCFPKGRIRFLNEQNEPKGAPLQGQAILYFGEQVDEFIESFRKFGTVARIE